MNDLFKSLVPRCPRVHFSMVWEPDELDESGEFMEFDVAIRVTTVVNGELLVEESEFVEGFPVAADEDPTDEDLILSGHAEELCKEALAKLKLDLAEGLPLEREISGAIEFLSTAEAIAS